VLTEVAALVVLLVSCGLLIRALSRVQQSDPGFRTDGVLTLRTALASTDVVLGAALAYAAGRGMEALLAALSPHDPASFAFAATLSVLMAVAGSLTPALRAIRVDPLVAIRTE